MTRPTFRERLAVATLGLLIGGTGTMVYDGPGLARAASSTLYVGLSPTLRMLSATDFWTKTGVAKNHDLDAETVTELQKVVDRAERPELSLRAAKLLCDNDGHFHASDKLSEADTAKAVKVAFEYLEAHLADAEVARFAPARGFNHVTISWKPEDADMAWVLIETVSSRGGFNGGLNVHLDLKASKVRTVAHWGDSRPAPAKP